MIGTDLSGYAFRRRGNTLVPIDEHASEWLHSWKDGEERLIDARKLRSVQQHRWTFALLAKIVDATEWPSVDALLSALKKATGHMEPWEDFDHKTLWWRPKSISFGSMSQDEFQRWLDRALYVFAEQGIDTEALMTELEPPPHGKAQ